MTSEIAINKLFDLLDDWRNLPAYQLERRADIFFAVYIPEIIKGRFGIDVEFLLPEFPIRVGNVSTKKDLKIPNQSFKIDYVAVSNKDNKVYFIELKTDDGSRRDKQDWYLKTAKQNNIPDLISGILQIYDATSSKKKYDNLIDNLSRIGWIDSTNRTNISHEYEIEIVYIQPNVDNHNTDLIISFDDIRECLSDNTDYLTVRFLDSLTKWKINPNK